MNRTLVIVECSQGKLKRSGLAAVSFAAEVGGPFDILLLGHGLSEASNAVRRLGAASVLVADHTELATPLADISAQVIAAVARARQATILAATTSAFAKDVLPRVAALLDAPMASDVIGFDAAGTFRRMMYTGSVIATVKLSGAIKVVTVRGSSFAAPSEHDGTSPLEGIAVDPNMWPRFAAFVSLEQKASSRPDATEARIVVSGGRAVRNAADFEQLIGGLADTLGSAVGSSRALVDLGITPNSLQIGQTGKTVAPDLYLAVGLSGTLQHVAGMKDARVIAAINSDAAAPIFEIADFGLVADIYKAVPEIIQKLKK